MAHRDWKAEAERNEKYLLHLTQSIRSFLRRLDAVMTSPPSGERGKQVAQLMNELEVANDRARYFGLDISHITDRK